MSPLSSNGIPPFAKSERDFESNCLHGRRRELRICEEFIRLTSNLYSPSTLRKVVLSNARMAYAISLKSASLFGAETLFSIDESYFFRSHQTKENAGSQRSPVRSCIPGFNSEKYCNCKVYERWNLAITYCHIFPESFCMELKAHMILS